MLANEISLLDPYERALGKCCIDPLRPPGIIGMWEIDKSQSLTQNPSLQFPDFVLAWLARLLSSRDDFNHRK